jgi:hypothetical protein
MALAVLMVLRAIPDLKVRRESRVPPEQQVRKVHRVFRVFRVK